MTIPELLRRWAEATPDAPALPPPAGRRSTTGGCTTRPRPRAGQLRSLGIGPDDRVAIVHPNGPELAAAFLAVSSAAVARAAQPGLPRVRARLLPRRSRRKGDHARGGRATRGCVSSLGRRVLRLHRRRARPTARRPATFPFSDGRARAGEARGPDDTALVLHTSGTTARPKLVPLTHRPARACPPATSRRRSS